MPSPKSGSAGSAVPPAGPAEAAAADKAIPGGMARFGPGAPGGGAPPGAPPHVPDREKKGWIEIELVDMEKRPVPGEPYRITLPDGTEASGSLDEKGFARVEGFDPGECKITFPNRDKTVWSPLA